MLSKAAIRAEAARLQAIFEAAGAVPVEAAILQPAQTLLDLYGEDIRARAFTTHDPLAGEQMLRPDFTVPVVQMHMASGADGARYTYAGEVFRRQEDGEGRASEYIQAGYEIFGEDRARADAEVFVRVMQALGDLPVRARIGDIGILRAAVAGLTTSDRRKAALMRHIWRPARFRALLDRFAGKAPAPAARAALLALDDPMAGAEPLIGLRRAGEIAERIEVLREDAVQPPLPEREYALIGELLAVKGMAPAALARLGDLAADLPSISGAVADMAERLDRLAEGGADPAGLEFQASHGRATMEYYDGFVFDLIADGRPDMAPLATGGRYDALTAILGRGRAVPAVGGVIRPALVLQLRGAGA